MDDYNRYVTAVNKIFDYLEKMKAGWNNLDNKNYIESVEEFKSVVTSKADLMKQPPTVQVDMSEVTESAPPVSEETQAATTEAKEEATSTSEETPAEEPTQEDSLEEVQQPVETPVVPQEAQVAIPELPTTDPMPSPIPQVQMPTAAPEVGEMVQPATEPVAQQVLPQEVQQISQTVTEQPVAAQPVEAPAEQEVVGIPDITNIPPAPATGNMEVLGQ